MSAQETMEAKGESEGMNAEGASCGVCGKPRSEWKNNGGRGVEKDGVLCCCRLCADRLNDPADRRKTPAKHAC